MSPRRWTVVFASLLLSSGCDRHPRVQPGREAAKPVVKTEPVLTQPFEEGYRFGFDLARQETTPQARLPEPAEVQRRARDQAAGRPDRTERWQRGFVDGYNDGFRNVVTGQK